VDLDYSEEFLPRFLWTVIIGAITILFFGISIYFCWKDYRKYRHIKHSHPPNYIPAPPEPENLED